MILGPQIKAYRRARKLTQKEFGKLIGVDQSVVSGWEKGAKPRVKFRIKIKEVLNAWSRSQQPEIPESDNRKPLVVVNQSDILNNVINPEPELYTIPEKKFVGRVDGFYIFKK